MKNNLAKYKLFVVGKLFEYISGTGITKEEIDSNPGTLNAVQSGEGNNGVLGKISLDYVKSKNYKYVLKECLTVARTGSSGFVSFQPFGCVVGDSAKILVLPDDIASTNIYLYLQTILTKHRYKYAYGRKVTEDNYFKDSISLPILVSKDGFPVIDENKRFSEEGYIPDWKYMEEYISQFKHRPIKTKNKSQGVLNFNIDSWKEFRFGDLIDEPYKGYAYTKEDLENLTVYDNSKSLHYITRTAEDNGCEMKTSDEGVEHIEKDNAITIGDTTATCFYQKERFITGDHMVIIRADWLNEKTALFVLSILNKEKYKYSYGRAFVIDKIKETVIYLPIVYNEDGSAKIDSDYKYSKEGYIPDWKYMEKFISSLPYGDRIK